MDFIVSMKTNESYHFLFTLVFQGVVDVTYIGSKLTPSLTWVMYFDETSTRLKVNGS